MNPDWNFQSERVQTKKDPNMTVHKKWNKWFQKKSILKNTVIQNTIRFWVIQMHKPCSLTSMAHIFKSLMRGFCASAASISFCASALLIASDSRALAALTWQRVFVLFAKETSGFTAPLATTRSWFSRWSLAKELRQAAVLA